MTTLYATGTDPGSKGCYARFAVLPGGVFLVFFIAFQSEPQWQAKMFDDLVAHQPKLNVLEKVNSWRQLRE